VVDNAGRKFVGKAVAIFVMSRTNYKWAAYLIGCTVEDHSRGCLDSSASMRKHQVRIDRLQTHLVIERPNDKLADRDRSTMRKERLYSEIRIDTGDLRRVERTVGTGCDPAIVDSFATQISRHVLTGLLCFGGRRGSRCTKIGSYLVGEHLFKSEPE